MSDVFISQSLQKKEIADKVNTAEQSGQAIRPVKNPGACAKTSGGFADKKIIIIIAAIAAVLLIGGIIAAVALSGGKSDSDSSKSESYDVDKNSETSSTIDSSEADDSKLESSDAEDSETATELDYELDGVPGTYSGEVNDDGIPNGEGKFSGTYTINEQNELKLEYTGSFEAGNRSGKGVNTLTRENGDVYKYEGMFAENERDGEGALTIIYANDARKASDVTSGSWQKGYMVGRCKKTIYYIESCELERAEIEGETADGQFNGDGVQTDYYRDGTKIVGKGNFENGIFKSGTVTKYDNSGAVVYTGKGHFDENGSFIED